VSRERGREQLPTSAIIANAASNEHASKPAGAEHEASARRRINARNHSVIISLTSAAGGEKAGVDRVAHYQRMAAECLRLVQRANDPTNKAVLLEMATTWTRLACEQAGHYEVDGRSPESDDE
jgi:hypothetical protein